MKNMKSLKAMKKSSSVFLHDLQALHDLHVLLLGRD